jgi:hypothetical protein
MQFIVAKILIPKGPLALVMDAARRTISSGDDHEAALDSAGRNNILDAAVKVKNIRFHAHLNGSRFPIRRLKKSPDRRIVRWTGSKGNHNDGEGTAARNCCAPKLRDWLVASELLRNEGIIVDDLS